MQHGRNPEPSKLYRLPSTTPSHLHWIEEQTDLRSCKFLFWSVISVVLLSRADDKESIKSTPTRPLQIALVNKNTQNKTHCFMRDKTEYKLNFFRATANKFRGRLTTRMTLELFPQ